MSNYLSWLLLTGVAGALLAYAVHRASCRPAWFVIAPGQRTDHRNIGRSAGGLPYGARLEQVGDINCQAADGDYVYGEFGWSTNPPGPTCTFTAADHGFDEVRGPSPVMSVWLALLAAGAVTSVAVVLRTPLSGTDRSSAVSESHPTPT